MLGFENPVPILCVSPCLNVFLIIKKRKKIQHQIHGELPKTA